ncbi:hypothetical protein D3C79_716700 [compost metagenome]
MPAGLLEGRQQRLVPLFERGFLVLGIGVGDADHGDPYSASANHHERRNTQRGGLLRSQAGAQHGLAILPVKAGAALRPEHPLIAADPHIAGQQLAAFNTTAALGQVGQPAAIPALAVFQGQAVVGPGALAQLLQQGRQHGIAAGAHAIGQAGVEQRVEFGTGLAGAGAGHPWRLTQVSNRSQARGRDHGFTRLAGVEGVGEIQHIQRSIVAGRRPAQASTGREQRRRSANANPVQHFPSVHVQPVPSPSRLLVVGPGYWGAWITV